MKAVAVILQIFFFVLLLVVTGCEPMPPTVPERPSAVDDNAPEKPSIYTRYVPEKVEIISLTEFVAVGRGEKASKIKVYVSLLDSFDSQIKTPGVFRFELYEYVPRSLEPKGKRIAIWPDINLTDPVENNNCWRDHFRAYEFSLDFVPEKEHTYILEVTCFCPNYRRLSDDFALRYTR